MPLSFRPSRPHLIQINTGSPGVSYKEYARRGVERTPGEGPGIATWGVPDRKPVNCDPLCRSVIEGG